MDTTPGTQADHQAARMLPPDPRTVAEMIPVRLAEIERRDAKPECHIPGHGVMAPRDPRKQTYEQLWCGVWYDCQAFVAMHRCGSGTSYASRELAAYHGEPYVVTDGQYETWDGAAWQPMAHAAFDAYWSARSAETERRQAEQIAAANRKPTVTYDGKTYTVRSRKTEIPNLAGMDRMAALIWLNQHTYATGAGTRTKPNPLAGMGDVIGVTVR